MKYNQFMEKTLKQRVAKGTLWVFISQITTQLIALVKNIIIARVLSPDDFGLFGIALIILSLFDVFTQTGFNAALIQQKEDIKDYLDTAFFVNIMRGFILFILLFFAAPYVSVFFKNTLVTPIVRVVSFTFLISGFANPGTIYFAKELDFKKQFYWDMSRTVTDIVVSLSIVFYLRNVWVLVIASISSSFIKFIVSYLIHPYRPKFRFNKKYASSLFKFGKWVLVSSILIYFITQGDDAFVGKFLGITMLGFYRMAYKFSNMPATQITHVISRVTFPAYSKIQDNLPKLREAFLNVLQITAFFSIPLAGFIFVLAPDFTRIFLGDKWMPMVPAMQVLSIFGAARSIQFGGLFQAVGKPDLIAKITFWRLILLGIIIYPLTKEYGITGTSLAVVISHVVFMFYAVSRAMDIIKGKSTDFIIQILLPLIGVICMTIPMVITKHSLYLAGMNQLSIFVIVTAIGIVVYSVVMLLINFYSSYKPLRTIRIFWRELNK